MSDLMLGLILFGALVILVAGSLWLIVRWGRPAPAGAGAPAPGRPARPAPAGAGAPAPGRPARYDTPAASSSPASALAAPLSDWLAACVVALHVLILGPSRIGKSTITHAIAVARVRAGQRVIVGDADARPGMWPDCTVYGAGGAYDEIESHVLAWALRLYRRRKQARGRGVRRFAPVSIVLPDLGAIMAECGSAREAFESVARYGGKLGIFLVADCQDKQRGTLRLDGAMDLLDNFDQVLTVDYMGGGFDSASGRFAGGRRVVRLGGFVYDVADLVDPELLADQYLAAHPELAAELAAAAADLDLDDDPASSASSSDAASSASSSDAASSSPASLSPAIGWSPDHARALELIRADPSLLESRTRLARALWGGNGKGKNNQRAGVICQQLAALDLVVLPGSSGGRSAVSIVLGGDQGGDPGDDDRETGEPPETGNGVNAGQVPA